MLCYLTLFPAVLGQQLPQADPERSPVRAAVPAGERGREPRPRPQPRAAQADLPPRRRGLHPDRGLHHRVQR